MEDGVRPYNMRGQSRLCGPAETEVLGEYDNRRILTSRANQLFIAGHIVEESAVAICWSLTAITHLFIRL